MKAKTKEQPKREATDADKALLAQVLKETQPYVEQKRTEKKAPYVESAPVKPVVPKDITDGKADYVFVDTKRSPGEVDWAPVPQGVVWHVCRSYPEFELYLTQHGVPKLVSFDYDLGGVTKKYNGTDAVQFLTNFCIDNKVLFPEYCVHAKTITNQQTLDLKCFTARAKVKRALNDASTTTTKV